MTLMASRLSSSRNTAIAKRYFAKPRSKSNTSGCWRFTAIPEMPEYKKQHYLPAVYLKEFSGDAGPHTRKSKVWVFDGQSSRHVRVERECFQNYFYSRAQAKTAERIFGEIEGFYGSCVAKIRAKTAPNQRDYIGLILMMFDLYLRNQAHVNETGKDNLHAYRSRIPGLCRDILLGKRNHEPSDEEVLNHLQRRWRVQILATPIGHVLLTSDNPAIWMASKRVVPRLELMLLPISPDQVAIAYDTRFWRVVGECLVEDAGRLNIIQCQSAVRSVYSPFRLSGELEESVLHHFRQRDGERPVTNDHGWAAKLLRIDDGRFSFLQDAPPLF
jgi:hypothetical protein